VRAGRGVDPQVYSLAETFVCDAIEEMGLRKRISDSARERLIKQAADAMQQAIEDELTEIEQQLRDGTS